MTSFRLAEPDDEPFIVSGWSSSYRRSRDLSFVQMERYAEVMHPIVRSVLARPRTKTLVAHGEVLHGFLSFEHSEIAGGVPLVLYIYVAQPYRRQGDAKGLFAAAGIDPAAPFEYACRTEASWKILEINRKARGARYNPYRARYAEEEKPRVHR